MLCIYPSIRCDFDSTGGCTRKGCFYSSQIKNDGVSANDIKVALSLAFEYLRTHSNGSFNIQSVQDYIVWLQAKSATNERGL
jgi:hypothetical protein